MLAAAHFDNLLVLLFFAAAIVFQILTKAASKGRRRPPETRPRSTTSSQMSRPLSTDEDESDEARIRKFLEALGQPTTTKPPPPVAPRTHIPPRPVAPVQPPASMRPLSIPQRRMTSEERRKSIVIIERETPQAPTSASKIQDESRTMVEPPPSVVKEMNVSATQPIAEAKIDIASMLRSASGLRNAIILREVFGPPRSMQPLDLVGSI